MHHRDVDRVDLLDEDVLAVVERDMGGPNLREERGRAVVQPRNGAWFAAAARRARGGLNDLCSGDRGRLDTYTRIVARPDDGYCTRSRGMRNSRRGLPAPTKRIRSGRAEQPRRWRALSKIAGPVRKRIKYKVAEEMSRRGFLEPADRKRGWSVQRAWGVRRRSVRGDEY